MIDSLNLVHILLLLFLDGSLLRESCSIQRISVIICKTPSRKKSNT